MYIRWLGAFSGNNHTGSANSLLDSLSFELDRDAQQECCAEIIKKGVGSQISHARIGLLVDNKAVNRKFAGDVFSVKREDGKLQRTRKPINTHTEAWVNPFFTAIVVKGEVLSSTMAEVRTFAKEKGLKVLYLNRMGRLYDF